MLIIGTPSQAFSCAYIYHLYAPVILSVCDVPYDQGGFVTLKWQASPLDDNTNAVSGYSIWRALPGKKHTTLDMSFSADHQQLYYDSRERIITLNSIDYTWEWIADQPAHGLPYYSYTAATLYDSMSVTDGKHYFFVSAHTYSPTMFYDSNIDSGCSVDNLAPPTPTGLLATVVNNTIDLKWDKSNVIDLNYYIIFRNNMKYDSTAQNSYIDRDIEQGITYNYKISAVDIHENSSEFSDDVTVTVTTGVYAAVNMPENYELDQNFPNPFNSATVIQYQLLKKALVQLVIFNMEGEQVFLLENLNKDAGRYQVYWEGKTNMGDQLPSGIYLYRLKAGDFIQTKKMILVR